MMQHKYQMHGALISANIFFGVGAVVGALGLPATHPLAFALYREFWAGLILLTLSYYYGNNNDSNNQKSSSFYSHWKSFAILGLFVFGNQAGFIVGIKMAGPVTASVWQPSQPIFTAAICMAMGWEQVHPKRLAGIVVASLGCLVMVLLKKSGQNTTSTSSTTTAATNANYYYLMGNALFFGNCLCTSLYVLLSKRMLAIYPALSVTAWSYNFAAAFMFIATGLASHFKWNAFFCPECQEDIAMLHLPRAAIPALLYYIVFASVGSYGLMTWANQHATGTLVMSYTALQPVTSAVLTTVLLLAGLVASCSSTQRLEQQQEDNDETAACLEYPSLGTFCGMMGVFGGLSLIISTEPIKKVDEKDNDDIETVPLTS